MKKLFTLFFYILPICLNAQNVSWSNSGEAKKIITKNEGQFFCDEFNAPIEFAYNSSKENFYFTNEGVVFEFLNKYKPLKSEEEKEWRQERKKEGFTKEEFDAFEQLGHRIVVEKDYLHAVWLNSNPNVEIIPSEKDEYYQSFSWEDHGKTIHKNFIPTYHKITYKNIYNNIDIEYEMHKESGIKYSIIIHPGGNINDIQLQYSKDVKINADGTLITNTMMGDIIDHRALTFYKNNNEETIFTTYKLKNNIISFVVANYDKTRTLVIDPWTQTPSYNLGWDCVWECETDAAGNTYTIGGIMPMVLNKYNATGGLVWTYNTPYDTTSWLGTFASDNAGNSYITLGSTAKIQKVNTLGTVVWNNASPGGFFSSMEFWNIEFNCDQTKLVVGGTGGTLPPLPYIYDIDLNSGNITSSVEVPNSSSLFSVEEVRAVASCGNGNYYYMTHKDLGYINDNLTLCSTSGSALFNTSSGFTLGYKCENWRVNNTGIEAMEYYNDFIYINRGNTLQKRKFSDASIVASVTIPGGSWTTSFGSSQVGTSGIAIDNCGNIYVGTTNGVLKYDQNLTLLTTYTTTNNFKVWDVEITSAGEVIAVGGTGTSSTSNRSGYVESLGVSACAQVAITCCDATMCPEGPLCITDPSFTITVATPGGVFAGTGITNATSGLFNPAIAGIGTHQISYTLPCGSDTIEIVVQDCSALSVCKESNGDLTVSGGTPTYTWSQWVPASTVTITNSTQCTSCGGTWTFGNCFNPFPIPLSSCTVPASWVTFATGVTVTPPVGVDSIRVTSGAGTEYFIYDIDTVSPCNATCDATINPAGPFCQNDAAVNLTATTPSGTWSGSGITNATSGTFNPSLSNPSNTITYTLPCGSFETITIITNANATSVDTKSACSSYTWINGTTYTSSNNTATYTIANGAANGCDSIVTLNLIINNTANGIDTKSACGSYTWINGTTYTSSNNTATFTIANGAANGCDSIVTLNLTINNTANGIDTKSACGSYTWINGTTYTSSNNTATYTIANGAANGCDSIVTLNLTINNTANGIDTKSACGSYTWINGTTYTSSNNSATFTIANGAANGCDSIVTLNLTINNTANGIDTKSACGSYTWINGTTYTSSNNTATYTIANGATNGCDSIVTLNLTINNTANGIDTKSACGSFTWIDGNTYTNSNNTATHTITGGAANGCDSIVTLNLTIGSTVNTTDNQMACGSYTWIDGNTYTSSNNTATYTIAGQGGACDTLATLNLTINNTANGIDTKSACGSYTWIDGNTYTNSNNTATHTITGGSANGCDSIVTLNLTIGSTVNATDNQTACGSYTWIDGNTYTSSNNTATYTIAGQGGACDTLATLNLTINNISNGIDTKSACGSFTWIDGNTYTNSNNTATHTIVGGAANGCDSIVTLNLTINNTTTSIDTKTACNTYTWIDGNTYTASNTSATHTITGGSANGCDSIVTLNLTINNTTTGVDTKTACNTYTWIDGNTYTASNSTATHTITGGAANGCDSIVTLNLTINNTTTGVDTKTACGSFTWIDGNTYISSNNTATHTITGGATNGCDSIVTLNLTIDVTYNITDTQTACTSFTWIDGINYTSSNNTANYTIVGQGGSCDTIITLILTINNEVNTPDVQTACNSFTWIDGNTYTSSNNTATYTMIGGAANGCDSTVTLNLSLSYQVDSTFTVQACDSFTWINGDGNTYTSSNNTATYTLAGQNGACDTSITLNLSIFNSSTLDLGMDLTINEGEEVILYPIISGGNSGSYIWTPATNLSCNNCLNPVANPSSDISYTLTFTNNNGCSSIDSINILVNAILGQCHFPTAFSPNTDNINDIYRAICTNMKSVHLSIYNRWGEKIYDETLNNGIDGWNGTYKGKEQNVGVYTFYAEIEYLNGSKENISGNFTLIK